MMRRLALPLSVLLLPALAQAESRLSVEDVENLALSTHPRLTAARARAEGARDLAKSAGGRMLPSVTVFEEYQHYDSPFSVGLASFPPVLARDQNTNSLVVGATQPILGLFRRSEDYQAESRNADASDAGVKVAEAATREAIEIEYLHMFEAKAMQDIAQASDDELGEEVNVTAAQVKAGTSTNADLLRVKVAQANARQQGIAAKTQNTVARVNLLSAIGMPPSDRTVEFLEPTSLLALGGAAQVGPEVEASALRARPEIKQATLAADAAGHRERARYFALFPEIDLEGAYQRIDGQVFAPKNSAFIGVKAQWPIWEWGASWNARRAALAEAQAAHADVEAQGRQVAAEVATRGAELEATVSAVQVAEQTIASAQEAYRVTEAQVRAGSATVTDLLDAQSALTQARLNVARARYEQAIARVQLGRAVGAR